ncbi:hypothetical protein PSY31_23210, partial [Shigella flexneri]|nr:hypothetical protein [Shigella flexneri]
MYHHQVILVHSWVTTSGEDLDEYRLGGIAKSMQAIVDKVSSFEGAEVPNDRKLKGVDFDV